MSDFNERTDNFIKFLQNKGVHISPKVAIADYRQVNQGRGLKALADIDEDEVLFSIPHSAMLQISDDFELKNLCKKYKLDAWSSLILRMMAVVDSTEWKPYFDVLPTEFNTPMFWAREETDKLLKGSLLPSKIGREKADALYDELKTGILREPFFANISDISTSRESFHRMGSLIMSYAFDIPEEANFGETKAMIPLADMLNSHTAFTNAHLTFPEEPDNKHFEMIASKHITKGEQIYNIYDIQPSSSLMRRYGYVELGGSPLECVEILLETIIEQAQARGITNTKACLEKFENFVGDEIDSFQIDMSRETVESEECSLEIEVEPELLILAQFLASSNLDRTNMKGLVSMAEDETLLTEARNLLIDVLLERKRHYGECPPYMLEIDTNQSKVLLDKQAMCTHIRQIELKVIDHALDWLQGIHVYDSLPQKKQKH